jgi:hypothetical protein
VRVTGLGNGVIQASGFGACSLAIGGQGASVLGVVCVASGSVAINGSSSATLDYISGTGHAQVGEQDVLGEGAARLDDVASSGAGAVAIEGVGVAGFEIIAGGFGLVAIHGQGSATLDVVAGHGNGGGFVAYDTARMVDYLPINREAQGDAEASSSVEERPDTKAGAENIQRAGEPGDIQRAFVVGEQCATLVASGGDPERAVEGQLLRGTYDLG